MRQEFLVYLCASLPWKRPLNWQPDQTQILNKQKVECMSSKEEIPTENTEVRLSKE